MNRQRFQVITVASLLAVLGAVVPLVISLRLSWSQSVAQQQQQLHTLALRTLQRTDSTLADIRATLDALNALQATPCSREHVARMRALVVEASPVLEAGYFADGRLVCNSWGRNERPLIPSAPAFTTADGLDVALGIRPVINPQTPMMAFRSGRYDVLLPSASLADIVIAEHVAVLLASHGRVVATLHHPEAELAERLDGLPAAGLTERSVYALARQGEWTAVATAPRSDLAAGFRHLAWLLVPAGAGVAALLVATVVLLSHRRLSPLGELKRAVRRREFLVHYQPVIDMRDGVCVGAEALVRWRREDGTLVSPDNFIPLAEQSGLIMPITDQVIERVVHDLNRALVADRTLHIAINLCAADLQSGRVLDVIARTLEHTGIQTAQIWLEATERGFMDHHAALQTIGRARARGHMVAIDDFGTGYSSLKHLQHLPLDALKIDKSFVDPLDDEKDACSITTHIIDIAHTLGLSTVAEGVETERQAQRLRAQGVEYAQGWLFSRPLPADAFLDYVRENRRRYPPPAG